MESWREKWTEVQIDKGGGEYDLGLYEIAGYADTLRGPLDVLGADATSSYRADGFLAVANVFDETSVASGLAGVDRLISGTVSGFRGLQWEAAAGARPEGLTTEQRRDYVRKLIYFVNYEPRLKELALDPALLRFVAELLGGEPELFADQALLKPPGIGREKPWHQDKAFFDVRPGAPVVGIWLALDPTSPENGCMHVIPGSHRDGAVIHFSRRDFQICDTDVRRGETVAVPLQPGGCLVFDSLLHHGTPANTSSTRRWALQFHYAPADALWRTPEERQEYRKTRLSVFGADGKDVTC